MKITFPLALFLIFMTLRLANIIDWSWWWVFAPLWVPIAIILCLFILACILKGIAGVINSKDK